MRLAPSILFLSRQQSVAQLYPSCLEMFKGALENQCPIPGPISKALFTSLKPILELSIVIAECAIDIKRISQVLPAAEVGESVLIKNSARQSYAQ